MIYAWHKSKGDAEPKRGYLGASIIGHDCDRYLWFTFRGCVKRDFDGRMYRLFETGNLAESRFVAELKAIGCEVIDRNNDGNQIGFTDIGGHFSGHLDSMVLGLPEAPKSWHVAEYKTHSAKSFAKLQSVGVKVAKPLHDAQMQVYMGETKVDRAIYLAANKDTDELYSERIAYVSVEFKAIMARAERIIRAAMPGERCATRPDDWRCKFCDAQELCWGTGKAAVPLPCKSCRTCCHATPELDGDARWSCAYHKKDLDAKEQAKACQHHLLIPGLIGFAEVFDAGHDWIMFKNADGQEWTHGCAVGQWTTEELMRVPASVVGVKAVDAAKAIFNGECVGVEPALPLIDRYPPEDCELLWEGNPDENDTITGVLEKNGIPWSEVPEKFEDDKHAAYEWRHEILLVIYKADNYAAIWKGKE